MCQSLSPRQGHIGSAALPDVRVSGSVKIQTEIQMTVQASIPDPIPKLLVIATSRESMLRAKSNSK
jgi:hypothetical protein